MSSRLRLILACVLVLCFVAHALQEDDAVGNKTLSHPRTNATSMAQSHGVDDVGGFLAEPCLVALADDRVLLCATSYRFAEGDRLVAQEFTASDKSPLEVVTPKATRIAQPCVALDPDAHPRAVWTELEGGASALVSSRRESTGWSSPVVLRGGQGPLMHPSSARCGGAAFLAWQEYRAPESAHGSFDVLLARIEGAGLGAPLVVSEHDGSDLDPVLAVDADRKLWVVWTRCVSSSYEVFARSFEPASGTWSAEIPVSSNPAVDDIHPYACCGNNGELWIAWDEVSGIVRGDRSTSRESEELEYARHVVRCIANGTLLEPVAPENPEAHELEIANSLAGGFPVVAVDPNGALHRAARFIYRPKAGVFSFPVRVDSCSGREWSAPRWVSASDGGSEPVAMCATSAAVWVAFRCFGKDIEKDEDMVVPMSLERNRILKSESLYLASGRYPSVLGLVIDKTREGTPPELRPVQHTEPAAADSRGVSSDAEPGPSRYHVELHDKTYPVFWGDLHRHSNVSRCSLGFEPDPDARYDFGRDVHHCDFYVLTDHSTQLDEFDCWRLAKLVELYQTPDFCTLPGFEWSTRQFGHQNVILRDRLSPMVSPLNLEAFDPESLWKLLPEGRAITIPHHTADSKFQIDWQHYDARFMRLTEVFQARRGNYEFDGCYRQAKAATAEGSFVQDGLELGYRFGLVASTDHGTGQSFAAVFAEKLGRHEIFDALYARRTYGTTVEGILLDFRVGGAFMGEEVRCDSAPSIELTVRGRSLIAVADVFRNGDLLRSFGRVEKNAPPNKNTVLEFKVDVGSGGKPPPPIRFAIDRGRIRAALNAVAARRRTDSVARWNQDGSQAGTLDLQGLSRERLGAWSRFVLVDANEAGLDIALLEQSFHTSIADLRMAPVSHTSGDWTWQIRVRRARESDTLDLDHGLDVETLEERWVDESCPPGASWYYVRIIQKDGEMAWSSPVFVDR